MKKLRFWLKLIGAFLFLILFCVGVILGAIEWELRKALKEMEASGGPMKLTDLTPAPTLETRRRTEVLRRLVEKFDSTVSVDGESYYSRLKSCFYDSRPGLEVDVIAERQLILNSPLWVEVFHEATQITQQGHIYIEVMEPDNLELVPEQWKVAQLLDLAGDIVFLLVAEERISQAEDLVLDMMLWERAMLSQSMPVAYSLKMNGQLQIIQSIELLMTADGLSSPKQIGAISEWLHIVRQPPLNDIFQGRRALLTQAFLAGKFSKVYEMEFDYGYPDSFWFPVIYEGPYLRLSLPYVWKALPLIGKAAEKKPYERNPSIDDMVMYASTDWDHLTPFLLNHWFVSRTDFLLTRLDLLEVALELKSYQQENGGYPQTLEELPSSIPVDRYTGTPFFYQKEGDKYRLYSVGEDRVDNGGVYTEYISSNPDLMWNTKVVMPE